MSASDGSSTRPFTDLEGQHRLRFPVSEQADGTREANQISHNSKPGRDRTELARKAATPAELEIEELTNALNRASVESLPNARLIIATPPWSKTGSCGSAEICLPHTVGGWNVIGVEQRITDVDFLISLPFYDPPQRNPSPRMIRSTLKCRISYHPEMDHCQLTNQESMDIHVTKLNSSAKVSPSDPICLSVSMACLISPGVWRISAIGKVEQHLVDLLVLQRQFVASSICSSKKRSLSSEDSSSDRLSKTVEKQLAAVPIAGTANLSTGLAPMEPASSSASAITASDPVSLLKLLPGNSVVIHERHSHYGVGDNKSLTSYELKFRREIDQTPGSRVFACSHSGLPGDVVAKALSWAASSKGGLSLYDCARYWKEEMDLLSSLEHPNIIKIKGFDGRLLVLYMEHLPLSLHRLTPVSPPVALAILVDVSSALKYLETKPIVHNDIKPANIAYSTERGGVLFDFGMATRATRKARGGTSLFLPPEYVFTTPGTQQNRGSPGDIWALGVTMLLCLGKIQYPKKNDRILNLANLTVKGSDDIKKFETWQGKIALAKSSLNQNDALEQTIFKMLDVGVPNRITASQIVAALKQQRDALPDIGKSPPES